ncbi:phage shock envelope stress response protein PspM [Rhodococcus sp. MALMAid1271]|uniref:phage shock envelope stress response protein PspM n=1 Tax=Rhodococcus sp. MALMAid1271 TaxID=3411744 RepID=UPI0030F6C731
MTAAVADSGAVVRSLAESARGAGMSLLAAAGRRKDPRAKHLKKIRRARRRGIRFGAASTTSAVGTAGLAVLSAPEWTLFVGGGSAAVMAVPAVFAVTRLRRLRSQPVPVGIPAKRMAPQRASAAYESMTRLAGAEQGFFELLSILSRSETIGADEIEEMIGVASAAARSLEGVAVDIAALERAGATSDVTREHLRSATESAAADLATGVEQYEQLVAAAARMTGPAGFASATVVETHRRELASATDRLQGWAEALTEIDQIRARHR